MKKKVPVAVIGTGLIGTDLLVKIIKSKYLECIMFAGQREESPGIAFAKKLKISTSTKSIEGILGSKARVVFDATNAEAHKRHSGLLKDAFIIDLTPAKLATICIPSVNLKDCLNLKEVNMGSCTVQAVIPKLA